MYHFYETSAPLPATCMKCGDYRNLFDLGVDVFDGAALLCTKCIATLAEAIKWVDPAELTEENARLTEQLAVSRETINRIPNQVEELINGVRSSVADFVLAVSGGSDDSGSVPVQGTIDSTEAVADNLKPAAGNRKTPSKSASH
jgi:hypothetical protein